MFKSLLVTGIGGDIGCSMLRCLNEGGRVGFDRILGCDVDPINAGRLFVDGFFKAPYANDAGYIDFLLEVSKAENVLLICPSTEQEIKMLDSERERFASEGIYLLINNHRIIQTFSSKYRTVQELEQIHVCVPRTWKYVDEALSIKDLSFPLIVKEDYGRGSQSVFVAHSEKEMREYAQRCEAAVIQEYIGTPEDEYTVGVFSNEKHTESIAFRRKLGPNGASTLVEYEDNPLLASIAQIIADEFDLFGSVNVQLRRQGSRYYVFEVNPRISSTVRFRWMSGFQDLRWWIDSLVFHNQDLDYCSPEPFIGLKLFDDQIVPRLDNGRLEW